MNIWQWILVAIPVIRFGASLNAAYRSTDKRETKLGQGVGALLYLAGYLFILFKAGVLIIL